MRKCIFENFDDSLSFFTISIFDIFYSILDSTFSILYIISIFIKLLIFSSIAHNLKKIVIYIYFLIEYLSMWNR